LESIFTIVSFALLIAAGASLWFGKTDAAFVLGALGAVVWFVGFRFRLRKAHPDRQATEDSVDDSDDSYEA